MDKTRKELAEHYRDNAKAAFGVGHLKTAWEFWIKIYNLYESDGSKSMSEEDFLEQHEVMEGFTDNEVYGITDFGKLITGYYEL